MHEQAFALTLAKPFLACRFERTMHDFDIAIECLESFEEEIAFVLDIQRLVRTKSAILRYHLIAILVFERAIVHSKAQPFSHGKLHKLKSQSFAFVDRQTARIVPVVYNGIRRVLRLEAPA